MSEYGPHFEFLDSRLDARWTEGKLRTPVGSTLLLGSMVEVDPASVGYLKQSAVNAAIKPKICGLLLQELQFEDSIFGLDPEGFDTYSYGIAKPAKLALITGGSGVKVRLKNIASSTRSDGRVIAAKTTYSATGLAIGDPVGWDGSKFIKTNGGTVTNVIGYCAGISSAGLELALVL